MTTQSKTGCYLDQAKQQFTASKNPGVLPSQ